MNALSRFTLGTGLIAPLLLMLPLPGLVHVPVAIALLGVAPGLAMASKARIDDVIVVILLAVLGSAAVTIAVATTLLYLQLFSVGAVALLVAIVPVALEARGAIWGFAG